MPSRRRPPPRRKGSLTLTEAEIARARRVLMRRDPRLRELIKKHGRCRIAEGRTRHPFAALVRTITSQQLSTKAAATILGRIEGLVGGVEGLTPDAILALDPAALRAAGLSTQKVTYVRDLAERVRDGRLDLHGFDTHEDDAVIEAITSVKGLGVWSAQMFLMFRLNRPDVFPVADLGIVKGMQRLHGMKRRPSVRTMERLADAWRPYRTVASWYLWRLNE